MLHKNLYYLEKKISYAAIQTKNIMQKDYVQIVITKKEELKSHGYVIMKNYTLKDIAKIATLIDITK